jgi:hypothetical protein
VRYEPLSGVGMDMLTTSNGQFKLAGEETRQVRIGRPMM